MPARRFPSALASVLAAVVALAAARPAAAQHALAAHAGPAATVDASPAAERVVARYAVRGARGEAGAPALVTVSDARGALVAAVRLVGEREARPMAVTVMDTDLVLQAETPRGLLTLVLRGQNGSAFGATDGRWSLGAEQGTLRGRARAS